MSVELSAECALGQKLDYADVYKECAQGVVPLSHGMGILLQWQCGCPCHPAKRPQKVRRP
ncbi:hypothetical protein Sipo8835_27605 [Streptomyces ipomoeae]|uniref:Uncharacterized protein n=2 Tax=Streptomyces ipomoeae TaxID=103232 RepID=L1KKZ4_9ACTN|nr:hypothetical protein STRIP9103_02713 [Streptomyces ipomoeae 91-03]TQE27293.1 hypothetical protein Sipo8835_27605 [Streptomyces ipomoeae]TQE33399.1 hypothetical protein Sipo7851_20640 [Streptomyces ipomoeae]